MQVCLQDLSEAAKGELRLASMPPLDGVWHSIRRIALEAALVEPGDVFWCLHPLGACDLEFAFLRGAVGVVSSRSDLEPPPGGFSLCVADPVASLDRVLALSLPARRNEGKVLVFGSAEESRRKMPELKGLQLCRLGTIDIFPPTCGQSAQGHNSAQGHTAHRCQRRAA